MTTAWWTASRRCSSWWRSGSCWKTPSACCWKAREPAGVRLGMPLDYRGGFREAAAQVAALERAGLDVVWVAEAWGADAPTQMGYLAASTERVQIGSGILPVYSRTPALLAQTA